MVMTTQPIPHNRIREFTSEATALAKIISGDFIGDPSSAVVRAIAEGLFAAYNTGCADATKPLTLSPGESTDDELALDLLHAMRPAVPRENFRPWLSADGYPPGQASDYLHVDPDEIRRIVAWARSTTP